MIKELHLRRFKRFEDETFNLHADGLTICAGPNSSGKSTLLHALAVWAFGVAVVRQFKGEESVRMGYKGQGAGISDDDFTPISIPDLKHLWLDLKTQLPGQGYSMSITARWDEITADGGNSAVDRHLTMAFSLVQDRLYIKAESSNLDDKAKIPTVIYLPPVAGIDAREEFATAPKRRAMLGRGLAGAVLRNYLYDLEAASKKKYTEALATKGGKKLNRSELKKFRETDPWSRLNEISRNIFGFELTIVPFDANFHSVLRVRVQPKRLVGKRWQNAGVARDLMVEGSGAQQWLTVLTFALSPDTKVLLLDEPDAHLFTRLKLDLVDILDSISCMPEGPQILLASHATEILKRHPVDRIMNFGDKHPKFLTNNTQRSKLISGLGDDYSPMIEKLLRSKILLFVENESDARILESISNICGYSWPQEIAILRNTDKHKDRLKFYRSLLEAIDGLRSVSLRDRDNDCINDIDEESLIHKGIKSDGFPDFLPMTWRRREIENYALIASSLSKHVDEEKVRVWWTEQGWAWPQDMARETHLQDCDIKRKLRVLLESIPIERVFSEMSENDIHRDMKVVIKAVCG